MLYFKVGVTKHTILMETNTRITATCECALGTVDFDGDLPEVRRTLGTLNLPSLLYGTWYEDESQARTLVPRARQFAITQEVFDMERNFRIQRFHDASEVGHSSIGCFSLATIPEVLSQRDIRFNFASSSIAICTEEHWQMNILCNLFDHVTYSDTEKEGETTLFGEYTKRIREEFQALVNNKFTEIAQRKEKHLTGADIDFLLRRLSRITSRFPVMQFVHRRFCTQKLLGLLTKKAGDNLEDQLSILKAVMRNPDLTVLLGYRICTNQRSCPSLIYTAVRALVAKGGEAVLRYTLEILRTGNNYALVGLSYSPDVFVANGPITSESKKPDFKQKNNPKRYSALSEVLNVLNETQKQELFRAIFRAVSEGYNDSNKALGLIALLYNLCETQPEVEDRGGFIGTFVDRYRIYRRTPLASLFNAVDRTEIEPFAITWFSLHAIGIMQGFFYGTTEDPFNCFMRNQECAVSIFEEKLKELSESSRMAMHDRMCEAIRSMKQYYAEENQKNLLEDLVSTVTAMFNRTEHEWTWTSMWARICQMLGKFAKNNPELVVNAGVVALEAGSLLFAPEIGTVIRGFSRVGAITWNCARASSLENAAENGEEHPNARQEALATELSAARSQLVNAASEPMRQAAIEEVRAIGHNLSDDHSDNRLELTGDRPKSAFVLAAENRQITLPQHPIRSEEPKKSLTRKAHLNALNLHPLNS